MGVRGRGKRRPEAGGQEGVDSLDRSAESGGRGRPGASRGARLVGGEIEEVVRLALEIGYHGKEVVHQAVHALEVMLGEHRKLLDGREPGEESGSGR